jgi:transposase-like protein
MKGYPIEFKLKVINEYRNNPGSTIKEVFKKNGVCVRNYYKWSEAPTSLRKGLLGS